MGRSTGRAALVRTACLLCVLWAVAAAAAAAAVVALGCRRRG